MVRSDQMPVDRNRAESWQEEHEKRVSELQQLADELVNRPMDQVLQYLAAVRFEAIEFAL